MWSKAVVVLTCLFTTDYISTQPLKNEPNPRRLSRQLDFGECCPCPSQGGLPDGSRDVLQNTLQPSEGIDDCPCRFRSTDSEGASSIFFPSASRSLDKQNLGREALKNILEPEVDLASSVLETLREVTEEEYQDAKARDAARETAEEESMLRDATPVESGRNIISIIVNPSENDDHDAVSDAESDASHVQESRCIHPLGKSAGKIRTSFQNKPSNVMHEILRLPKRKPIGLLHRNLIDMDSYHGASNVLESVFDPTETTPFTQLSLSDQRYNSNEEKLCSDSTFASSNMQERFAEKQNPKLKLKSLIPGNHILTTNDTPLTQLIKLKDVELLSPGKNRNSGLLPQLHLKPFFNREGNKPLDLNEFFKEIKFNLEKNSAEDRVEKPVNTEILDTVPNTSKIIEHNNNNNICEKEDFKSKPVDNFLSVTEINESESIPDAIFSPSQNKPTLVPIDDDNQKLFEEINNAQKEHVNLENEPNSVIVLRTNKECEGNIDPMQRMAQSHTESAIENELRRVNTKDRFDNDISQLISDSRNDSVLTTNNMITPKELLNKEVPLLSEISKFEEVDNDETILLKESIPIVSKSEGTSWNINEMLKTAQENLKKKLDRISHKSLLFKPNDLKSDDDSNSRENLSLDLSNQETNILDNRDIETKNENNLEKIKNNDLSMSDLQKLSNSLLKLNNQLEEQTSTKENQENSIELNENKDVFDTSTISNGEHTDTQLLARNSMEEIEEDVCLSNFDIPKKSANSGRDDAFLTAENPVEMDIGASEPISSTIFKNPSTRNKSIFSGVLVEPRSTNEFDIERSNILSGLPILDDISDQMSAIFGKNEGNEENSSGTSSEANCSRDEENRESLMSAEPSTLNTQGRLAPIENMNLELFQWKPLSAQSDVLNSFRRRLTLPKKLELTPMKLQSTLGKKDSLLGATISLSPSLKPKSRLYNKPLRSNGVKNVLASPVSNLLNFDDFTSALREHAQSLLSKGKQIIPANLEPVQSVESLSENMRSRAENAAKNIQQSIQSTFRQVEQNKLFGDNIPTPEDLLERIASARENLNDKLIGLQYDLNDRLTSLHRNVFDQSRFNSNRIPVLKPGKQGSKNVQNLRKSKPKPVKLLTAESKSDSVLKNSPVWNNNLQKDFDPVKPSRQEKADSRRMNAFKLPSNVSIPKSIEIPRLEHTIRKPPTALSHKYSTLKRSNSESSRDAESPKHRSLLRQQVNPFKDSKFKITFATTTQEPTTPMIKSRTSFWPNSEFIANRGTSRLSNTKSFDANVLPSEIQTLRLPAPIEDLSEEQEEESETKAPIFIKSNHLPMRRLLQPAREKSDDSNKGNLTPVNESDDGKLKVNDGEGLRKPWPALKWPKNSHDSILTQIREAIKSKKANSESDQILNNNNKALYKTDMAKSASENTEVAVFDKHLKENVAYKCKMICTRENSSITNKG